MFLDITVHISYNIRRKPPRKDQTMKDWQTLKGLLKDIKTLAESKGETGIDLIVSKALFIACELEPVSKKGNK